MTASHQRADIAVLTRRVRSRHRIAPQDPLSTERAPIRWRLMEFINLPLLSHAKHRALSAVSPKLGALGLSRPEPASTCYLCSLVERRDYATLFVRIAVLKTAKRRLFAYGRLRRQFLSIRHRHLATCIAAPDPRPALGPIAPLDFYRDEQLDRDVPRRQRLVEAPQHVSNHHLIKR